MGWAEGKHALVTGGGSGIGAAAARALAAEGAKTTLLGRRREPIEAVAAQTGGLAIGCDLTDRTAIESAFAEARSAHGPIDWLILNAGIADSAPFGRTAREDYERIIATNLTSLFDCAQLALPDLKQGEGKRIVIVASVAGVRGVPLSAPYAASKHGALGLMRSLALEFVSSGMTINAVCPGFVDTPMTDQSVARIVDKTGRSEEQARSAITGLNANGRLVAPEEVAHAIAYLCHPLAGSVTGAALMIDGGTTA